MIVGHFVERQFVESFSSTRLVGIKIRLLKQLLSTLVGIILCPY